MLVVHRAPRADELVEALVEVVRAPLLPPLAREVVAVPTRGIERWLSQRLGSRLGVARAGAGGEGAQSSGDGVCANFDWPSPGGLVSAVVRAATGRPKDAAQPGPWSPEAAVWPLLRLVDDHIGDPRLAVLARHLEGTGPGPDGTPGRRLATVRHLAQLFDRYGLYRPEMARAWSSRDLEGREPPAGGGPGDWAPPGREVDAGWQSLLWRLLRDELGEPSPAEMVEEAVRELGREPSVVALPARVSCFGLTRLPASQMEVLSALALGREVHLFVLHPSPARWSVTAGLMAAAARAGGARTTGPLAAPRSGAPVGSGEAQASHPLLRSWGRDALELQLVLGAYETVEGLPVPGQEPRGPASLLRRLQEDIRRDQAPPGPPRPGAPDVRPLLSPEDRSLQVHSCYGRARQVEVAREAVLHIMASDPGVEPRDVVVMCPDVEELAPLVQAVFGTVGPGGGPALPVSVADRSVRQTNPVLGVAAHLLELVSGRAGAAEVLDFMSRGPVSRRFDLDQESLALVASWVEGTGVRWGIDDEHREQWGMPGFTASTWQAGLERLLLGVAIDEDSGLFGGTLAYGDLAGPEVDLAGRLAELVSRLGRAMRTLGGPMTVASWCEAIARCTLELCSTAPGEEWQTTQLRSTLAEVAGRCPPSLGARSPLLALAEVRDLLAEELRGRPTRANFRTGAVTVCTLAPMRSVPHRVVCLVGLDDGAFPRPTSEDGDDLMACQRRPGDWSASSEDRQMLLDALMAATGYLVMTYQGHDQHLNQPRPPAVPVSELLDVVDRTVRCAALPDGTAPPARTAVVVEHPLQPFDRDNFRRGALVAGASWRFDQAHLDGAVSLAGERKARAPFLRSPLPPLTERVVPLASLVRFLEHPVRAFLRQRLGYYPGEVPRALSDLLPLELGPLERWAVGDRALAAVVAGTDLDAALAAELGRGLLPPGLLGEKVLAEVRGVVKALMAGLGRLEGSGSLPPPVEVDVALPDGRSVVGTVPGAGGGKVVRVVYSKLAPKHRLRAWVQFVALSAAHPGLATGALTLGQSQGSRQDRPRVASQVLSRFEGDEREVAAQAVEQLARLVDLFDRGMREPLPIYCATSAGWAEAGHRGGPQLEVARKLWSGRWDGQGEAYDPEHVAVLGGAVDFEQVMAEAPEGYEQVAGWPADTSRFGRLATRLWAPVLAHEAVREEL